MSGERRARRQSRLAGKFFAPALLQARSVLHLSYRLSVRTEQLFAGDGAAGPGAGWRRWAMLAFIAWDFALFFILRRSEKYGLRWRLPIDALDMAFWALSPLPAHRRPEAAVLVAIPLAIEGGFRIGARALVVPAVGFLTPGIARTLAGQAVGPGGFGGEWLIIGVGLGMGLYRYCHLLNSQAEAERQSRLAANRRRAFLGGQNAVAMGASSVVDAIEGVVPILGRPQPGSALWQLADGWKADLGSATGDDATYLQVAVLEWERAYNRHPDLSTHVVATVAEGDGTLLLTGSQPADLGRALTELQPRQLVRLSLADPAAATRPPGQPLRIEVASAAGTDTVEIAGDRDRSRRAVDPGPVAFVFMAAFVLHDMSPDWAKVAPAVAALGAGLLLAAAFWSHRQLVAHGLDARLRILYAAMVVGLPYTVLATLTQQPYAPQVGTAYLFGGSVELLAFIAGAYDEIITRRIAALVLTVVAVNIAIALLLHPAPPSPRMVLMVLVWSVTPYFPFRVISGALSRASREHLQMVREEDEQDERAAFAQGQKEVLDLVGQAGDDARRQLAVVAPTLRPDVATEVTRRLSALDDRIAALR